MMGPEYQGLCIYSCDLCSNLTVAPHPRVGGGTAAEDLPKEDAKTPHITDAGEIAVVQCLHGEQEVFRIHGWVAQKRTDNNVMFISYGKNLLCLDE